LKDAHSGKEYDFITCFSVTKWIHLYHGDTGLIDFFKKIYMLLREGGKCIIEPQPWRSYHNRKFASEQTKANFHQIQLRPKDFPTCWTKTIGFKKCTLLRVCETSTHGFRRPIYLLEK
jgi:7SK snRNA methylphosphate capping enzyme